MLESDQPSRYSEEELHAISALANQAAIAMENARLYAEAQERTLQLEVVTRVTQEVSTRDVSHELPGILRTIIHQIRRVVPCDYAALALYNEEDDTFTFETVYDFAVRDWAELPPGKRVPADGTLLADGLPHRQGRWCRSELVAQQPSPTTAGWRPAACARAWSCRSSAPAARRHARFRQPRAGRLRPDAGRDAARAFALPRHRAAQRAPVAGARGYRHQAGAHPGASQSGRQGARRRPAGIGRRARFQQPAGRHSRQRPAAAVRGSDAGPARDAAA